MREKVVKLYQFDELSETAKETVVDKMRDINVEDDWWYDGMFEDFEQIANIIGIEFSTHAVKLMGGGTRYEPNIYFSGFSSQGDGACFEGTYRYEKGAAKKIREYAPKDDELYRIARRLQEIQKPYLYRLTATVKHHGNYSHEYMTEIDVEDEQGSLEYSEGSKGRQTHDAITELLRDFMRWMYRQLEKEYEYLTSDEAVTETIRANEYWFDESGELE